jgi:hypothetical protein
MTVREFISNQPGERQKLLTVLNSVIIENDKSVTAGIGSMMGQEIIKYNTPGIFKYGLGSGKNYITLHAMPMYGSPVIYSKYKALLPKAKFQKGCINFKSEAEMPLNIVQQFIQDCSKIDLLKIRDEYQRSKNERSKAKR